MKVDLPLELENYVQSLVQTGNYSGSSDVIQEALRQHRVNRPGFEVFMTPELEKLLDEGLEDFAQARTTSQIQGKR